LRKIENVARRVARTKEGGNEVVVVLSAMAGETDRLIQLARKASEQPVDREFDALISTGEQVTITLLAMVLQRMGYAAKSFLGSQVKVHTDRSFTKARIVKVDTEAMTRELKRGVVVCRGRFPGGGPRRKYNHPRKGRLGHERRRPRGGPEGGPVSTSTPTWTACTRRIPISTTRPGS
jgi:aspartokinase